MTIVAVYNMKGGVGKTTCAVNLGYLAAQSGRKTLIWDLDAQAAATFALRVSPEETRFGKAALRNAEVWRDAVRETDHLDLDLLPADFSYRNLDRFLDQLGDPKRVMRRMLAELGSEYGLVLLDCPAGFTALSEAVIASVDVLLVPTIPTTLSMRTLLRLTQSLGPGAPAVLPFVSMMDRRKALHASLARWAENHPEMFLRAQIPYASSVEQMGVRRAPVAIYDARDPAARAFANLWREVEAHLAELARTGSTAMASSAACVEALDTLLRTLVTDAPLHAPACARSAVRKGEADGAERDGVQWVFAVSGKNDFRLLERALDEPYPRRTAVYVAHTFDSDDGALRRAGYRIRLIEEAGGFRVAVVKESPAQGEGSVFSREQRSARIDGGWAAKILTGELSPTSVIERRIRHPLAEEAHALVGERALVRIASSEHESVRLGPVEMAEGEESASLHLELDCAEGPRGETACEVIACGPDVDSSTALRLLGAWRKRAGVGGQLRLPGLAQPEAAGRAAPSSDTASDAETAGEVAPVND